MVQKAVTDALKGGKNKRTQVAATEIEKYSDEDEDFGIDNIDLAYY